MGQSPQIEMVLVHGGFSDASIWRRVIPALRSAGHAVSAAQLPLTGIDDDVRALERHLTGRSDHVLLVGHSYGGVIITDVAARIPKVEGVAYVSSPVPPAGQPFGAFAQGHPPPRPVALAPDANGYLWATAELLDQALGRDLSVDDRELFRAVQKPMSVNVYGGRINGEGWRTKPSWYLVTTTDLLLSVESQRTIAAGMKSKTTDVACGHLSLLSNADEVAKFCLASAKACGAVQRLSN